MAAEDVLILDAEALSAIAHAKARTTNALRAMAVLRVAWENDARVCVPSAVLAEVYRGGPRDAAVDHALTSRGVVVLDLNAAIARRAGALLARTKLGSAHAVGAFVVATALFLGGATIATHDPTDLERLVGNERGIRVWSI
jgi:predicted nucleic acid-binding protein